MGIQGSKECRISTKDTGEKERLMSTLMTKKRQEKVVQSAGALKPFFEGHKAKLSGNDSHGLCGLCEIPALVVSGVEEDAHC